MGTKIDQNKQHKKDTLLKTAFHLFTTKGIAKTSISEIVEAAGIAKGTFYLYFTDKYDIRNKLIAHESSLIFKKAGESLAASGITNFDDRIIFIVDHILNQLNENQALLNLINKNLSWGIFKNALIQNTEDHPAANSAGYQLGGTAPPAASCRCHRRPDAPNTGAADRYSGTTRSDSWSYW